jgi:hypothetical protein
MRKTSRLARAAINPTWYRDHRSRIRNYAEDSVCIVATGLGPDGGSRWTTDEADSYAESAVDWFNSCAAHLDERYSFPLRLRVGARASRKRDPQDISAQRRAKHGFMRSILFTLRTPRPRFQSMRHRGARPISLPRVSYRLYHNRLSKLFNDRELVELFGGREASPWGQYWAAQPIENPREIYAAKCRAIAMLLWLSSGPDRTPAIDLMLDFLTMAEICSAYPLQTFEAIVGLRGGIWDRRLRKNEKGRQWIERGIALDNNIDLASDQLKQHRRELFRRQAETDHLVRLARQSGDPDLGDVPVDWPHWIVGHAYGLGVLVPIEEPHVTTVLPASLVLPEEDDPATE